MYGAYREHTRSAKMASGDVWVCAVSNLACDRPIRDSLDDVQPRNVVATRWSGFNNFHRMGDEAACHDLGDAGVAQLTD